MTLKVLFLQAETNLVPVVTPPPGDIQVGHGKQKDGQRRERNEEISKLLMAAWVLVVSESVRTKRHMCTIKQRQPQILQRLIVLMTFWK